MDRISEINYKNILIENQDDFQVRVRHLSQLGKTTVIKSLAVSKAIHLFT